MKMLSFRGRRRRSDVFRPRRLRRILTALLLSGLASAATLACGDEDLFLPGEIPVPPTAAPTETPDDGDA